MIKVGIWCKIRKRFVTDPELVIGYDGEVYEILPYDPGCECCGLEINWTNVSDKYEVRLVDDGI